MKDRDIGYDVIRAAATVMIVAFHFVLCAQEATGKAVPGILHVFTSGSCSMGRVGVAWFFLLSGSVLHGRYGNGMKLKDFYIKRMLRLYIPLWIGYAFFYMAAYPANPWMSGAPLGSILSSLLGMDFYYYCFTGSWDLILVGEWFTSVIVTVYLLFPLLRYLFSRFRAWATAGILALFALNLHFQILTAGGGNWSVMNGLAYFWLGMLFDSYKGYIRKYRFLPWVSLLLAVNIFAGFREEMFGNSYLPAFFCSLFSYAALYSFAFLFKPLCPAVRYISRLSYEVYLVHHRIYYLLIPAFLNADSSSLAVVFVFLTTAAAILLLSEKLFLLSGRIQTGITAPKKRET